MDKIAICNMAIGFVGGSPIMSFEDEILEAELCDRFYDAARSFCLESRDWTFAAQYRRLAPLVTSSPSEFSNSFQLPSDCLSVRIVSDDPDLKSPVEYQKDGRVLWANESLLYIKYTKNITDTSLFSPIFQTALAQKLAEFIATPLTGDKVLKVSLRQEAELTVEEGGSIDGMQGSPKRAYASKLLQARHRGGRYGTSSTLYPWGF